MLKLATIFKSRGNICGQRFNRNSLTQDVFGLLSLTSCAGMSSAAQKGFTIDRAYGTTSTVGQRDFTNERVYGGVSTSGLRKNNNDRIYAAYYVYKGKAALSAEPFPPTFCKIDSGGFKVKRTGCIMLSFSPAVGERKYDWQKKQVFALSVTEVGSLIALANGGSCEFFHDPSMKSSNAGQVRKTLSIKPTAEGNGYFIGINVVNAAEKINERFSVPVTSAEFAVMRTSFSFVLPYIMGWDQCCSQQPALMEENSVNVGQQRVHSEWDR